MDGITMVMFLSFTMLVGSFLSGLLPLALTLSENKMRHITILGAGLLIGTALAVIIPEGIHAIYTSNPKRNSMESSHDHVGHEHAHKHKRREIFNSNDLEKSSDVELEKNFLKGKEQFDKNKFKTFHVENMNVLKRIKKDVGVKNGAESLSNDSNDKKIIKLTNENIDHDHETSENAHSAIGVTLIMGFVFMLLVDQIGGKFSHRHHQMIDPQSIRNKITFTTTLGLVVHSAADGIALGAAAATTKTDVEMIVFLAIMLHKAPAAFGLVSFLLHEGLERVRVRKHLIIFSLAAPVMAILTFLILKSQDTLSSLSSSDSTGLCMLFSGGTFLYVSTVHVLPEVQSHNEDRQFRFGEMCSFILGSMMPLVLSIGHSH